MTTIAERIVTLEKELNRLPMVDHYVAPQDVGRVLTNVAELTVGEGQLSLLRQMNCVEKDKLSVMSDFEVFALLCRVGGFAVGHGAWEDFCCRLAFLQGKTIDEVKLALTEDPEETSRKLWRRFADNAAEAPVTAEDLYRENCVEKRYPQYPDTTEKNSVEKCGSMQPALDLDWLLTHGESLSKFWHRTEKDTVNTLYCDLRDYEYQRPNPYLTGQCVDRIISGENLNCAEKSAWIGGMIIRILNDNKCGKTQINFRLGVDVSGVEALLSYLKDRGVSADVCLAWDGCADALALSRLCAIADDGLRIIPAILMTVRDSNEVLYRRLCDLAAVYPIVDVRMAGVESGDVIFFSAHLRFRHALARWLCEHEGDDVRCLQIGKAVLSTDICDENLYLF